MQALTFLEARATVLREVRAQRFTPACETVPLDASPGRILAEDSAADRDYPPFHRATRDGFAMQAGDLPGRLRIVGEARAGARFEGTLNPGEAIEIMTGAPVPESADAIVMIEHCVVHDDGTVSTDRAPASGSNIARAGSEAAAHAVVLPRGTRIDYSSVAWLATTGRGTVSVYVRPRVAILATGDEIVPVGQTPSATQIRNSNAHALAAQVRRAGGDPVMLPVSRDEIEETRRLIRDGLTTDLLLLSGGVSAGKYDLVEPALAELDAYFYFDRVLIQPGQPVVFGRALHKFFFGLPGNPASTLLTFELFARAAIDLLSGAEGTDAAPLPMTLAKLSRPFSHKAGLTRFLPARLNCTEVTPVDWQGSADVPAICRANAFLVAAADQPVYAAGDLIPVMLK